MSEQRIQPDQDSPDSDLIRSVHGLCPSDHFLDGVHLLVGEAALRDHPSAIAVLASIGWAFHILRLDGIEPPVHTGTHLERRVETPGLVRLGLLLGGFRVNKGFVVVANTPSNCRKSGADSGEVGLSWANNEGERRKMEQKGERVGGEGKKKRACINEWVWTLTIPAGQTNKNKSSQSACW